MSFSSFAEAFNQPTNRLYEAREARLKSGRKVLDLVSGNVNAHGLAFPEKVLQQIVQKAIPKTKHYHPDPLGQEEARKAISKYYRKEGVLIPSSHIVLTPGTSISYWYCFKLLANPGDEILCPSPSYPLFESIASLSTTKLVSYPLAEGKRWSINLTELEKSITSRTRSIVLISPHNPTGAVATEEEVQQLCRLAREKNLPIISDEVFAAFIANPSKGFSRPASFQAPLVLTLNGLSKMLALAGAKIGWIGVTGDPAKVQNAMQALDMMSDTFLPVNEWIQAAIPGVLEAGASFLRNYRAAIHERSQLALEWIKKCEGLSALPPEGGFFMTVRLEQSGLDEENFATELLKREGILVHPGYFYDMPGRHFIMATVATSKELALAFKKIRRLLL